MSDLDHRGGVKEVNLVVRHLKLEGITAKNKQVILDKIDRIIGIDSVSFDEDTATLNLAYDATHCDLDLFQQLIQEEGADLSHSMWTRVKEGYYKYVDQNVKDNSEHDPYCNNALPKALPGSRKH
ncbi:cation transporter [Shewanella eurypsychrophilus]|uniref:Cation transporter n=1 Tax=Shewanella eurypsychrophilus TaxID=2593656 RepID=A0ABX6V869_9GAMM|nr:MULTISPECIES: cation transporter [Shewanella]QFU22775.1 cation transporter [Shewanella sp. YLB-09]QPG58064.1 cation transporter [Shewanella eurypsychrophilus]